MADTNEAKQALTAAYFAGRARRMAQALVIAEQTGPEAKQWLEDCLKAFASEWKRYEKIQNVTDRHIEGFPLFEIEPDLWLLPDGTCALARKNDAFRNLSTETLIGRYRAAKFLECFDVIIERRISQYETEATDFQAALKHRDSKLN